MITEVNVIFSQDGGETESRFTYTIKGGSTADAVCIALDYLEVDLLRGDDDLQNYSMVLSARPVNDVFEPALLELTTIHAPIMPRKVAA
jgi:hypothetical protein